MSKRQEKMTPELSCIVDEWFRETYHNRPIDTDEYNRLYDAKERLKARLSAVTPNEGETRE